MAVDMSKVAVGTIVAERVGRDGRSLTSEIATGIPDVFLAVMTFHRQGGSYRTTAVGVRHMPREGAFSVTKSSPMDYALIGTVNEGQRFSRKTLDKAHNALAREAADRFVDEYRAGNGELLRVIAATPEA